MLQVFILRISAIAVAALLASACQYSPDMGDRTIAYNRAVADSTSDLFLLNAVRASHREPTYYSRTTGNTALSTISPTISLADADPLGRSLSTAIGPMGTTTTLATVAKSLTAMIAPSESNSLTLQNLDDQQSVTGLLTPVQLQYLDHFSKEGWNFEELFLMFTSDIRITRGTLSNLPNAIAEHCAVVEYSDTKSNPYCDYFFSDKAPKVFTDRYKVFEPDSESTKSKYPSAGGIKFTSITAGDGRFDPACFGWRAGSNPIDDTDPNAESDPDADDGNPRKQDANGTYYTEHKPHFSNVNADDAKDVVVFTSDPALDEQGLLADATYAPRTFTCFKEVARALMALDLGLGKQSGRQLLYTITPAILQGNPRLLADATQQLLEVVNVDAGGDAKSVFGICKPGDTLSFSLTDDAYVTLMLGLSSIPMSSPTPAPSQMTSSTDFLSAASSPSFVTATARANPRKAGLRKPASVDCKSLALKALKKDANDPAGADASNPAGSVSFTPRSLEGMVYFVGQNIRRIVDLKKVTGNGDGKSITFLNAANPRAAYEEDLFRIETDIGAVPSSLASIQHDGTFYSVPPLCTTDSLPRKASFGWLRPEQCSIEYPDHASPQILNLLNEIWGLQKAVAALPVTPTVTLIGH